MLLDDSVNDNLLRAEIARESGRFDEAIEVCDRILSMNAEKHVLETATLIRAHALAKDQWVFKR